MFTRDDLVDAILEVLKAADRRAGAVQAPAGARGASRGGPPPAPKPGRAWEEGAPKGRPFLSESEIKKALTPGAQHLTIAKDAIVSPLALDWLALRGIRVVRQD